MYADELYHKKQNSYGKKAIWFANNSYIKEYSLEKKNYIKVVDSKRNIYKDFVKFLEILNADETVKHIYVNEKEVCFNSYEDKDYIMWKKDEQEYYWETASKNLFDILKKNISCNEPISLDDYFQIKKTLIALIPVIKFDGNIKCYVDYIKDKKKIEDMMSQFYIEHACEGMGELEIQIIEEMKKMDIDRRLEEVNLTEEQIYVLEKHLLNKVKEFVTTINKTSKFYAEAAVIYRDECKDDIKKYYKMCDELWRCSNN